MNTQLPRDPQEKTDQKALTEFPAQAAYKSTATRFYWIAGLSLVNSLIAMFGGSLYFPVGLGITQVVDVFASVFGDEMPEARMVFLAISLVINVGICGLIVLFGYLISRGNDWPLITGMVLYALDAVLMLFFQDWIGAGFHAYFLFLIWSGYSAIRQWKKSRPQGQDSFPRNIGAS